MDTTTNLTLHPDQEKVLKDAGFTKTGSSQYSKGSTTISWVDCPIAHEPYFSVCDQGSLIGTSYRLENAISFAETLHSIHQGLAGIG